jgi:hypothetical protein
LLIFAFVLKTYFKRFQEHSRKALFQTLGLVALGLTINYKFLLLLPIAFVFELLHRDGVLLNLKTIGIGILILLSPYLVFAVFSVFVGLPFYKFPVMYSTMFNFTLENPAHRSGKFRLDFFYYLQYLWHFESPLIWFGLMGFPVLFRRKLAAFSVEQYLFGFSILFLGGVSLLLKAPRGLLIIYALLYLSGFLVLKNLVKHKLVFAALILGSCLYNIFLINREIYAYSYSNYERIAQYLKKQGIKKVAGTVGLNSKPFLTSDIAYTVALDTVQLQALRQSGYRYLLLDDYRKPTNITAFDGWEHYPSIVTVPEKTLEAPLLYLEHSEFTGLSFNQTMALHEKAVHDTVRLRLIKLP